MIYHHGKTTNQCKACNVQGHKPGDDLCEAKADEGSILAFRGHQHPLSNHYPTPIYAFNETESFKSVEHAWFWKMASDLEQHDLAARIKEAEHAGKVKYMSKEIAESDRFKWEDEHFDIMTSLLIEKTKTCEPFRNCLLENREKFLGECTQNLRWGTGMSKWFTERTQVRFWPGSNYLGRILMDITEKLLSSDGTLLNTPVGPIQEMDQNQDHDGSGDGSGDMELEQWHDVPEKEDNENREHDVTHSVPKASIVDPQITTHNALNNNGHENPQDVNQPTSQSCTDKELHHVSFSDSQSGHSNISAAKAKDKTNDETPKTSDPLMKASHSTTFQPSSQNSPVRRKSVSKSTTTRRTTSEKKGIKDIRSFMDEKTGKRKTQETTPEKQPQVKKPNT